MRQRKEGKRVPCIPTRLSVLCEGSPEKSDRSQMTALSSSTVARDEGIQRTEEWVVCSPRSLCSSSCHCL